MPSQSNRPIAFLLPTLECGGAERMTLNLVQGAVDCGLPTHLIVGQARGALARSVPPQARLIELGTTRLRYAIPALARYLRREQPHGLLSRMTHTNFVAVAAARLAGGDTRIAVTQATHFSTHVEQGHLPRWYRLVARWVYRRADVVIAVSASAARDLHQTLGVPAKRLRVIYNPVVDERLLKLSHEDCEHPWLSGSTIPVFLHVGRLDPAKDQTTLLRAFAQVAARRPARLLILGEGPQRGVLERLRSALRLDDMVDLPGYCGNPYPAMRRASAFVLSSRYEGLPNALIEALALGCPTVSTACPSGPEEVLDHGRYGHLVPPGDVPALASAMLAALNHAWDRKALQRRGLSYSVASALPQYLAALDFPLPQQPLAMAS